MASLPRRALLGARLAPDAEAFTGDLGVAVTGVTPGSMAAEAGLRPGDRLVALAGVPIDSPDSLARALRAAGHQQTTTLQILRADAPLTLQARVHPFPVETVPHTEIAYDEVSTTARLRAIVTRPAGLARAPGILFLQGISCESIDFGASPDEPFARLVHAWARAGLVTMRVDKRGTGDSEGPPCRQSDFATELDDHRAALDAFAAHPAVDPTRRFLFGHSVGGMVAALLAAERRVELAGVIVFGTAPTRWLDCLEASFRRQHGLRHPGLEPAELDRRAAAFRAAPPDRTADYHTQLHATDLEHAWRHAQAPVLVLRGEHDWVVGAEEQARIAELAPRATLRDVPAIDHLLTRHATRRASLERYGDGAPDDTLAAVTIDWLVATGGMVST